MRPEIVDELEEFVRRGRLWNTEELEALIDLLRHEADVSGDGITRLLCTPLESLLVRMRLGPVPAAVAADVEAVVYPRLWKVMEAARDGLPDAELRTRIEVLNRRLARIFAAEGTGIS
ncbi:MAG: hypothetical protein C4344_06355 [Acidimicrobiia bacterium]